MNTCTIGLLAVAAALSMLSCGDAVQPPAEGTIMASIHSASSAPAGYACQQTHSFTLGDEAPSLSNKGKTWVDGQAGHSVSCTVRGSGTYSVSAKIAGNSSSFQVTASQVSVGGDNPATVSLFDTALALNLYDEACTIEFSGDLTVEKGAVWAMVSCNHLISKDDGHLWCGLNAMILFKSCSTS
jgi:hypothetical protein